MELNRAEHGEKILAAYPRRQIQLVGGDDHPKGAVWMIGSEEERSRTHLQKEDE